MYVKDPQILMPSVAEAVMDLRIPIMEEKQCMTGGKQEQKTTPLNHLTKAFQYAFWYVWWF